MDNEDYNELNNLYKEYQLLGAIQYADDLESVEFLLDRVIAQINCLTKKIQGKG